MNLKDLAVLVTRAAGQASSLKNKLEALGATVYVVPVIAIQPPCDWSSFDEHAKQISTFDWLIFLSENAVQSFVHRYNVLDLDKNALSKIRVAAVGESTASALSEYGLRANCLPKTFDQEGLVEELLKDPDLSKLRFFWPRTNVGRNLLKDKLCQAGAQVVSAECYRTELPPDSQAVALQLRSLLSEKKISAITLTSSQCVKNLAELLGKEPILKLLEGVSIVSIGPQTSAQALASLGKVDVEAQPHTTEALVSALVHHVNRG